MAKANTQMNLIDALFSPASRSGLPRKTVISGSINGVRTDLVKRLIARVVGNGFPVIVVHRANRKFIEAYGSNSAFDPTSGLSDDEIASLFMEVGKSAYGLSTESKAIVSIGLEVMRILSMKCDLKSICGLPWETISEFIFNTNEIPNERKLSLIRRIEPFSIQTPAVAAFFTEISVHAPLQNNSGESDSVFPTSNTVLSIDIGSDVNTMYTELVLAMIKLFKEKGRQFLTVLDSLPIPNEHSISYSIHKSTDTRTPVVIMSPDLAQTLAGKTALFSDVIGSGINAIVFSHSAGMSAEVWSNFFGEFYYRRKDVLIGESREKFTILKGSEQKSVTETEERRRYIPPEKIMLLDPMTAFARFGQTTDADQPFEIVQLEKRQ